MFRVLLALVLIALLGLQPQTLAQNTGTTHQHAGASAMIDGAVHPELVPDSIAYRLYFIAVSVGQNPTDTDRKRQQAHLSKIGLQEFDREILAGTLSEFKAKYDALVTRYNQAAEAALARNEMADVGSLLRALDGLVQSTRDSLKLRLTPRGVAQLDSFVQLEKKNMKVQSEGQ